MIETHCKLPPRLLVRQMSEERVQAHESVWRWVVEIGVKKELLRHF